MAILKLKNISCTLKNSYVPLGTQGWELLFGKTRFVKTRFVKTRFVKTNSILE